MRRQAFLIVLVLLALPSLIRPAAAGEGDLELRLVLRDAAVFSGLPEAGAPAVLVDLERAGNRWERGWASSAAFGNSERAVRVDSAEVAADAMQFDLTVTQPTVGAVPGERFKYSVQLTKGPDGRYSGSYTGTVRGAAVKGAALGEVKPPRRTAAGYRPLEPGEHPRLLFRKADLAALRQKAQTPFGKLAMSKMPDNAAGLALRYQITGDAAPAAEARKRVEAVMADIEHGDKRVRSRWFGLRMEQAALAYDMCYDAWPEDFRKEVAEYLLDQAEILFYQRGPGVFDSHITWHLGASHGPPILYGAGLAGLVLRGEKGPRPAQPVPPYAVKVPGGVIEPAKDYTPGKGVTVADLTSGVMPMTWIYVGAFPQGEDHLAGLGGRGGIRPEVGTKVTASGMTAEFQPLVENKGYFKGPLTGERTAIEVTGPAGVVKCSMGYFYAVLRNDAERWVRFESGHGGVEGYLNGTRIAPREVVRLKPGLYPLLVTGPIGYVKPWGKVFMEPRFVELTPEEAQAGLAAAKAEHEEQLKDCALDAAEWERAGGADVRFLKACGLSRFILSLVFREVPGTGGMAPPGGDLLTLDGPNKYALAHRIAMGCDVTPYEDIAAFIPYKMFVHTCRADGKGLGLECNGPAGFASASYPDNSRPTVTDNFATLFPLVRDEWKPAALWAWQFHTRGAGDEAAFARILTAGPRSGWAYGRSYGTFDTHPLYAFVGYPLDLAPQPPQDIMPRTWQAPDGGFYGFRNNWSGTDDEIVTHFYSSSPSGGAGTIRLAGLGQVWSGGINASAPARFGENVVQLPQDVINEKARGILTALETHDDGSGAVCLDLNDVYSAPKLDENDRAEALYEKYGGYRRPSAFVDQGIGGRRALAVDYSGRSGAPCLIAMADSIRGGGPKLWAWQIESKQEAGPPTTRVESDVERNILFDGRKFRYKIGQLLKLESRKIENDPMVQVAANGFTLTQGGAALRATFLTPRAPKIELAERVEYRQGVKSGVARNSSKAVFAEGGDEFFVVLTLQRGPAPAVQVSGEGLAATATVGKCRIRFDGRKIVLGE